MSHRKNPLHTLVRGGLLQVAQMVEQPCLAVDFQRAEGPEARFEARQVSPDCQRFGVYYAHFRDCRGVPGQHFVIFGGLPNPMTRMRPATSSTAVI